MNNKNRIDWLIARQVDVLQKLTYNGTDLTASLAELAALNGLTASVTELNKLDAITGYPVEAHEVTFTETSGAGVWTGAVAIPAGATLIDVIVYADALWDSQTSATMIVGDTTDPNGFYDAVDLKATDLLAGESLSFALAGGKAGAYIANSHAIARYLATAREVIGEITKVGTTGTAGRTRMVVVFALPTASAAVKV
jgi:hypothetical protein